MASRSRALTFGLLGLAGAVLLVHSLAYNFVTDDAYISFVFSRNFAEHGQLVFNLGQPVEGYTNFLWTLVLGIGMLVGIPPEISSRVLGVLCALGTLYLAFRVTSRAFGERDPWATLPALLLACSAGFACWTSGGLETQLFAMLVTWALDCVIAAIDEPRAFRRIGIALALAAMTRPEGLLVAVVLGGVHLGVRLAAWWPVRGRIAWRDEWIAKAYFLALWGPWFAWRLWYYGYWAPNTYYVKAHGPWASPGLATQMWHKGVYYVWVWLLQSGFLYAVPIALLAFMAPRRSPRFVLAAACWALIIVYLVYAISVGGDFMGLHRFIMPVFVAAAILVALGLEWLSRRAGLGGWAARAVVVLFACAQFFVTRHALDTRDLRNDHDLIDTPAFLIMYTEDRATIGRAMEPCFLPDDFSIVGGAGAQPYFGRMRGIDVFGLVSEKIAHDEPRIRARSGHTKFGNDDLLASYDPTFVFSCYDIRKDSAQPHLPCADFWLRRGYEEVTMHIPGMRERGEYYTFLAKKARSFQCPGRVH
ncbi:MAG TPA: hypothetical protein VGM88_14500 [Kofleriaceae bacterium]|jgi:hypothetical protein